MRVRSAAASAAARGARGESVTVQNRTHLRTDERRTPGSREREREGESREGGRCVRETGEMKLPHDQCVQCVKNLVLFYRV